VSRINRFILTPGAEKASEFTSLASTSGKFFNRRGATSRRRAATPS
jgi:hypothetical protein